MSFNYSSVANLTSIRAEILPHVLPILVRRAKEARLITYGELAEEIHTEYGVKPQFRKTNYGWPVGVVGELVRDWGLSQGTRIPPLNVIVVDKAKGRPGSGADHVAAYFSIGGVSLKKNRDAYMKAAAEAVFNYRGWDQVAEAFGAEVLPLRHAKLDDAEPIQLPVIPKVFGPESPRHKALKLWVRMNPGIFHHFGKFKVGRNEFVLSSGDRLDCYFLNDEGGLAVEVKASNADDNELKRGVYQCVKYRAVLRAEKEALRLPPIGSAVLVSTRRPGHEVRQLLKRLQVDFVLVPIEAES